MAITLNGTTGITTPALDSSGPLTSLGIDDNATSTAITIDASNNVGIGTSSPSGYDSRANNLVVGDAGDAGITIFSGATSNARLQFAPSGSTGLDNGLIGYDNSNDLMVFATGGSDRMRIDSTGAVTMPYQPAFLARPSTSQNNFVVNTTVVLVWGSEVFDQNSDFASNQFTAPVTGKYLLTVNLALRDVDSAASYIQSLLITSNRSYELLWSANGLAQDVLYWYQSFSVFTDMDAGDIAYVSTRQQGGTQQLTFSTDGSFAGYLVC